MEQVKENTAELTGVLPRERRTFFREKICVVGPCPVALVVHRKWVGPEECEKHFTLTHFGKAPVEGILQH